MWRRFSGFRNSKSISHIKYGSKTCLVGPHHSLIRVDGKNPADFLEWWGIDKTVLNGILFSYKPLRYTEAGFWQQEHQLDSFACQKFMSGPSHCERWIIMSPLHHSSSSSSSLPMFLFANHLWLTLFLLLIPLFVANEGTQHNQSHLPAVGESQDQTNQQWAHSSCLCLDGLAQGCHTECPKFKSFRQHACACAQWFVPRVWFVIYILYVYGIYTYIFFNTVQYIFYNAENNQSYLNSNVLHIHWTTSCPKKMLTMRWWHASQKVWTLNTSSYWEKEIVTHSGPLSCLWRLAKVAF